MIRQKKLSLSFVRTLVLLLLLVVPAFGLAGCQQGPRYTVSDNAQTALAEGEAKEKAAQDAENVGSKSEAVRLWTDAANYYGAVARKFGGSPDALRALLRQGRITDVELENLNQAHIILRSALRNYPPARIADKELTDQARELHDDVVRKLDANNSQTYYYKAMDLLVRLSGNQPVIAITVIAVVVTLITWPLRVKMYKSSREMQRFQPELKKLQEKYRDDPMTLNLKMREFQKEHGINMYAGCLPALAQWPILFLMYQVIVHYQFHFADSYFLWINPANGVASASWAAPFTNAIARHLGEPDMVLLGVYALSMYFQMRFTPTTDPQAAETQRLMATMMPPMFFFMMYQSQIASAFILYWFISNLFSIGQQWIINRSLPKVEPLVLKADAADSGSSGAGGAAAKNSGGALQGEVVRTLEKNPKLITPKNKRKR